MKCIDKLFLAVKAMIKSMKNIKNKKKLKFSFEQCKLPNKFFFAMIKESYKQFEEAIDAMLMFVKSDDSNDNDLDYCFKMSQKAGDTFCKAILRRISGSG